MQRPCSPVNECPRHVQERKDGKRKVDKGQFTQHPTGNGDKLRYLIATGSYCRDLSRETA